MANYLSQKIETLEPMKPINTQLVGQVLAAKQGQYNLAKQQINQTLDAFENLKVLREQDQAYIEAKLTDLRAKLDNSAYKDLSDINLSDNLMSQIKTAAKDPFIVDAMANTAKFNNFQQQLAQLKEKKPELYNDANYAYAMWKGGVQDYIDGKSNGIGELNYINYTDYNKEVSDTLVEFEKMNDDEVIQLPDPNNPGQLIKVTKKGLSPEQIRQIATNSISQSGKGQMQIDAWANSNKFQDEQSFEGAVKFIESSKDTYDTKITDLETKIKQGGSDEQLKQ